MRVYAFACALAAAIGSFGSATAFAQSAPPVDDAGVTDAGIPTDARSDDAGVTDAVATEARPATADAIAALTAKQAELERRVAALTAAAAARDDATAADATKRANAPPPPPGVAFSLLGVPIRIFASFALRYDYSVNSNLTDTLTDGVQSNWLLTRIRFGAEFGDTGPVTGGFRLSSGENPSPTVPFVILADAFRPASFGVDQAWGSVRPFEDRELLQLTFGRMKNPFWRGSTGTVRTQMLWDDDVNPAGIAITGRIYKSTSASFPFTIEDVASYMQIQSLLDNRFVGLTGVVAGAADQIRFLSTYVDAAVSYYEWWNLNTGLSVPTAQSDQGYVSPQAPSSAFLLLPGLQATNTVVNYGPAGGASTGFLYPTFHVLNPNAEIHVPVKAPSFGDPDAFVLVDYAHNFVPGTPLASGNLASPNAANCKSCTTVAQSDASTTAAKRNDGVGVTLGARLGDKTYERAFHPMNVWITYRYVQSDAALATFADSDLGAGTGYRGFGVGVNYRVFKNLMASAQYFDFMGYPNMENHVQRAFFDVVADF